MCWNRKDFSFGLGLISYNDEVMYRTYFLPTLQHDEDEIKDVIRLCVNYAAHLSHSFGCPFWTWAMPWEQTTGWSSSSFPQDRSDSYSFTCRRGKQRKERASTGAWRVYKRRQWNVPALDKMRYRQYVLRYRFVIYIYMNGIWQTSLPRVL